MSDTRSPGNGSQQNPLGELRELLFGEEKEQLDKLQERLDQPELRARDVSRVLPQAIRERAAEDEQLGAALGPTIVDALHASIKREPQPLVDVISPVMGPAIRRSISQAIRGMVQSLNRTLEHSVSWRGWQWRIEAWRTGKSFGEVVLLHTLVYQVEHVFLIHRESGLLLQHVGDDSAEVADTDLVSGMLSAIREAIQDFAEDSFGKRDTLQALRLSERRVWIEAGPAAVLGIVIRGEAPESLRVTAQESLEQVHIEQQAALEDFAGDTGPFEVTRDNLERCLQTQFREQQAKSPTKALLALGLAAIVLIAALGYWGYIRAEASRRWGDFVQQLRDEPGIVIAAAERRGGRYHVSGLRDPLARDPSELLQGTQIQPDLVDFTWEDYHAFDESFAVRRVADVLAAPDGVSLQLTDGVLVISGEATLAWREMAQRVAATVPGVVRVDVEGLRDATLDPSFDALVGRLRAEPGYVLTSATRSGGKYILAGLRDPLARDFNEILRETSVALATVTTRWDTYHAVDDGFVLQRARQLLQPPEGVGLRFADGILTVAGEADAEWITLATASARGITGVTAVDRSQLEDRDRAWREYVSRVRNEPGIVVVEAGRRDERYVLHGLRDPLSRDPVELLDAALNPDNIDFHWDIYHSLDSRFTLPRATQRVSPPDSVTLTLEESTLHVAGSAGHRWITEVLPRALQSPGIDAVDERDLQNLDQQRLETSSRKLAELTFLFDGGADDPTDQAGLETVAQTIKQLLDAAAVVGRRVLIRVEGHAANSGDPETIQQISEARAMKTQAALVTRGIVADQLQAVGVGASRPVEVGDSDDALAANRRVTFAVIDQGPTGE